MPLFGLLNVKRKLSAPTLASLGLKKTHSTGDIDDSSTSSLADIVTPTIKQPTANSSIITSTGSTTTPKKPTTVSILRPPSTIGSNISVDRPPTPPSLSTNTSSALFPVIEAENNELLANKLRDITACDMELLLSMETQARMDCQEEKEKKQQEQQAIVCKNRPSKIKFDLPITPPRSRSPDPNSTLFQANRQRRWSLPEDPSQKSTKGVVGGRLSRWSKLIKQQQQEEAHHNKLIIQNHLNSDISSDNNCSSSEEDLSIDNASPTQQQQQSNSSAASAVLPHTMQDDLMIGSKVKLFKRPLPIIGTVKYIGKVHFDTGEWLGIELDSRGMYSLSLFAM